MVSSAQCRGLGGGREDREGENDSMTLIVDSEELTVRLDTDDTCAAGVGGRSTEIGGLMVASVEGVRSEVEEIVSGTGGGTLDSSEDDGGKD